jgi:hypothetical protein
MKEFLNNDLRENNLFKSYYCSDCKQRKVCERLDLEICCACIYQKEVEKAKEYSDYQQVYQQKLRERKEHYRQLELLKNYRGCPKCRSKEVDAYELFENNRLVCQPCLIKKEGNATGAISFSEQSK